MPNRYSPIAVPCDNPPMAKLVLDLHDIYNKGGQIDRALDQVMQDAIDKKIRLVEIIPGKGSGALKKKVLRYLDQKHVRAMYHRIEKDSDNWGRLFVHFRF
jgi:DNA-nicking Smr family endonuclease